MQTETEKTAWDFSQIHKEVGDVLLQPDRYSRQAKTTYLYDKMLISFSKMLDGMQSLHEYEIKKLKTQWLSQLRKEIEGLDFSDVKIVANKKGDELHPNAQSYLDGYFEAVHDVLNLPSLQETK